MKIRRPWTERDDQVLAKALAEGVSLYRLVALLKRQERAIRIRAKVLGDMEPVKRNYARQRS